MGISPNSGIGGAGISGAGIGSGGISAGSTPVPPPPGPVLLCPYVMQNDTFSSYSFTDGVAQGDTGATLLDTLTIAADNGKIAIECELVSGTGVSATVSNGTDSAVVTADGSGTSATSGALSTTDSVAASNGDRVGIIIDTDTGAVDYVNEQWHENFAEAVQVDVSEGAGFVLSGAGTVKAYTKSADMQLPYPAGTTDSCLTGGLRELVASPLLASEALLQSAGLAGKLDDPDLAQQRGFKTISGTAPASSELYGMGRSLDQGAIDLSNGKAAIEYEFNINSFTPDGPGGQVLFDMSGQIINGITSQTVVSAFVQVNEDSSLEAGVLLPASGLGSVTPASGRVRIGVLLDNGAGIVRAWVDGTELTLSGNTLGSGSVNVASLLIGSTRQARDDNGAEGTTHSVRLITDPYWFTTPFPAGSRDINGNVFN